MTPRAERWMKMAAEARAIAERTSDPAGKKRMLEIAASYDKLTERAKALARRRRGGGTTEAGA